VEKYPYVAMDTEFPGVVARPISDQYSTDYQYQTLRCNVDLLKIIQLGKTHDFFLSIYLSLSLWGIMLHLPPPSTPPHLRCNPLHNKHIYIYVYEINNHQVSRLRMRRESIQMVVCHGSSISVSI
jgi:hypothetical protein